MKTVQINSTCGVGSTGKICVGISQILTENQIENYILYTEGNSDYKLGIKYSGKKYTKLQALKSRVFGNYGFNSGFATKRLIKLLEKIKPDNVIIHNVHGHNVNLKMLFSYFKKNSQIKLYWVFHDCWAFTGYCPYFTISKCDKWLTECKNCPQSSQYSWFFDKSSKLFAKKKELFSGLNLQIITPSIWLAELAKKSIFKDYPVKVINNGIDLSVFLPTESDFREKYNVKDKFILLGVAFDWGKRKGLDVFVELAKRLDKEIYQIVLVGTNDDIDASLPKEIITIHRTQNQQELAKIYSASDLFVNPTREENYPTVNMESVACGTPVLTFNTGGSPEMLDQSCGSVVDCDDIDALEKEIKRIREEKPFTANACKKKSEQYDMNKKFAEYAKMCKGE